MKLSHLWTWGALFALTVPTAATQAQTTLEIWGWAAALDALKAVDEAFAEAHPDISLNYVARDTADVYQQIQLGVAAGAGLPDISVVEDSHLAQYVELGVLADLSERVAPYSEQIVPYKWTQAQQGGRTYAMPWDAGPVAVFYHRPTFEQAGVDPSTIATWDDYYEAAKVIKEATGVPMMQLAKARNSGRMLEKLLWQRGLGYVDAAGRVILDTDPRVLETLEYLGRFWQEDLAADTEEWTDAWYKEFAEGRVATHPGAVWMGTFLKSFIAPDAAGAWGVFKLPAWDDTTPRAANDGGSALVIFADSEQQEAAWAYLEFHLGRPESQLAIYQASDLFPSLTSTYSAPFFSEGDPYFGGQEVRALFAEVMAEVPDAGVYSADYTEMNALLSQELQRYALGRQSAQEALERAAAAIRDRTRRE